MSDLEQAIKTAAEKAVLKIISSGNWIAVDYGDRFKIPNSFVTDVWKLVDADKLKAQMVGRIEEEVANRVMNHIAAEIATDVKKILSIPERREEIRAMARNYIDSTTKEK